MVAWGSSLDSTVVEVVALFEKMEALFSFMSGLVAVLAPLEKKGRGIWTSQLSFARKCVEMKGWKTKDKPNLT